MDKDLLQKQKDLYYKLQEESDELYIKCNEIYNERFLEWFQTAGDQTVPVQFNFYSELMKLKSEIISIQGFVVSVEINHAVFSKVDETLISELELQIVMLKTLKKKCNVLDKQEETLQRISFPDGYYSV